MKFKTDIHYGAVGNEVRTKATDDSQELVTKWSTRNRVYAINYEVTVEKAFHSRIARDFRPPGSAMLEAP